jgi:uncharacterized protein YnzC (UPF0291/DUF896 family)
MTTQQETMSVDNRMNSIRARDTESIQRVLQNIHISEKQKNMRPLTQWEKDTKTMTEAYIAFIKFLVMPELSNVVLFGGFVRDMINGEEPRDFDVSIPFGFITKLKSSSKVQSLLLSGFLEEVNDSSYDGVFQTLSFIVHGLDGRKIDFSYQTTRSRIRSIDFTCNALVYDVKKKSICVNPNLDVDLFQAMKDIQERKIRFVQELPSMDEISQMDLHRRRDYYKLFSRYIKMVKRGWKLVDEQTVDIKSYSLKEEDKQELCPITMEPLSECGYVLKTSCGHKFDAESLLNALHAPRSHCPYCRSEVSGFVSE